MDLSLLTTSDTAICTIKDPLTNTDTDIKIEVYSIYSSEFKAAFRAVSSRDNGDVAFMAELTKGWEGIERDGKPVEFSKDEAVKVYTQAPIIHKQLDAFVGDIKHFFINR